MTVELLTPKQVATVLGVHQRTPVRWAKEGKLGYVRTKGGHRRFFAAEVDALRRGEPLTQMQVRELRLQAEAGEQQ